MRFRRKDWFLYDIRRKLDRLREVAPVWSKRFSTDKVGVLAKSNRVRKVLLRFFEENVIDGKYPTLHKILSAEIKQSSEDKFQKSLDDLQAELKDFILEYRATPSVFRRKKVQKSEAHVSQSPLSNGISIKMFDKIQSATVAAAPFTLKVKDVPVKVTGEIIFGKDFTFFEVRENGVTNKANQYPGRFQRFLKANFICQNPVIESK